MRPRVSRHRQPATATLDLGRKHKPDYWLLILCLLLLATGLIVVYAISPALSIANNVSTNYYVTKQMIAIALSGVAFAITSQLPLATIKRLSKPLLYLAAGATIIALLMPVNPAYPAHRWVRLGSLSFQSVELVKFAILITVSGFLAKSSKAGTLGDFKQTIKPLLIGLLIVGLLIAGPQKIHAQSDLGSMAVMVAMVGAMCFVIGMPMRRLLYVGGILAIGVVLVILPSGYRRERLLTFVHPESNCQTSGYQACQSIISVGSGGIKGLGLGRSVQAYGYQPEAANDSIFAIFAEKFGFIGCITLLGVFVAFFSRIKNIAERTNDEFSRLLCIGVLAWLSTQSLINIGGMIGLLPLKGITLPFISYGGTSVVFLAAAVGLVFQVSRHTSYAAPGAITEKGRISHDDRYDGRRLRGAYHPDLGSRL
jgi:cell division protein FtsW